MHRPMALLLAIPVIAGAWVNDAFAQDPLAYGEPYDDPDVPYDDYDADGYDAEEPYDAQEPYDQPVDPAVGSIDDFHGALAPYGTWVRSQQLGLVWVPSRSVVGASFVPYSTGGRWQSTNVGWMFTSDWAWGWAPFHYGRWYRDPGHGWAWVPGSVWAPAWVDWRFGGGVVGWAPLPPRHHRTAWVYTSAGHMNRPNIGRYVHRDSLRYTWMTTPVRHRVRSGSSYWFSGPRRQQIESASRTRIRQLRMQAPRAGVVVRVRVDGSRVRRERLAPPRDRLITRSRRLTPSQRQRVTPQRQRVTPARPKVTPVRARQPVRGRDVRGRAEPRRDARPARPASVKPDTNRQKRERDRKPDRR